MFSILFLSRTKKMKRAGCTQSNIDSEKIHGAVGSDTDMMTAIWQLNQTKNPHNTGVCIDQTMIGSEFRGHWFWFQK